MPQSLSSGRLSAPCGSSPVTPDTAERVPRQRVFDAKLLEHAAGTYPVVFVRDAMPAHVYNIGAYVDGKCVADIGGGEALTVYLALGYHRFGVGAKGDAGGAAARGIGANVTQDDRLVLRLSIDAWGWGGWDITQAGY